MVPFRGASPRCKSSQKLRTHWSTSQTAIFIVLIMVLVLEKQAQKMVQVDALEILCNTL